MRRAVLAAGAAGVLATSMVVGTGVGNAGAADANKLTVTAGEYTYKFSGKPKPGNVEIEFDNAGVEIHMMAIIGLKPGVTKKQLEGASLSDGSSALEKLLSKTGFNVSGAPGLLSPDLVSTNITSLPAGHYGLLCFVPAPDGEPHIAHGMVAVFDTKGSKSTLKPPTDGVTEISVSDSGFTIPSTGLPKSGWIKVTNEASIGRDVTLAGFPAGTTFEQGDADIEAFFETGQWPSGQATVTLYGGVGSVAAGKSAYFEVQGLTPGSYTLVSSDDEGENEVHTEFQVT